MPILVFRLAAPLQSWGARSRFDDRDTQTVPTKSAICGFLAAALGRGRDANMSDLASLTLSVRVDRPGVLLRDFHTAGTGYPPERQLRKGSGARHSDTIVTERWYLADAAFTVAVAGDAATINVCAAALTTPRWPLFLGRRSCPTTGPVLLGVIDSEDPTAVLVGHVPPLKRDLMARANGEFRVVADDPNGTLMNVNDQPGNTLSHRYHRRPVSDRLMRCTAEPVDDPYALALTMGATTPTE